MRARRWSVALTFGLAALSLVSSCGPQPVEPPIDPHIKGSLKVVSPRPGGTELLITDCPMSQESDDGCDILLWNTATGSLAKLVLPDSSRAIEAHFNRPGDWIALEIEAPVDFDRVPTTTQLARMRADGSDYEVAKQDQGLKLSPHLSDDATRMLFWTAGLRPPGSKSTFDKMDVWEHDFGTGDDVLFAGPFRFNDAGTLNYLTPDRLLIGAGFPAEGPQSAAHVDALHMSEAFVIDRGATTLPDPVLRWANYANWPYVDTKGNIHFAGEYVVNGTSQGSSWLRESPAHERSHWTLPIEVGLGQPRFYAIDPDGKFLFVTTGEPITSGWNPPRHAPSNKLFRLDLTTSKWTQLTLPTTASARPIQIRAKP